MGTKYPKGIATPQYVGADRNIVDSTKEGPAYGTIARIGAALLIPLALVVAFIVEGARVGSVEKKLSEAPLVPIPSHSTARTLAQCFTYENGPIRFDEYREFVSRVNGNPNFGGFPSGIKVPDLNGDGRVCGARYDLIQ